MKSTEKMQKKRLTNNKPVYYNNDEMINRLSYATLKTEIIFYYISFI